MNRKQRIFNLLKKNLHNFTIEIVDNSHNHAGHNNFNGIGETHILLILKLKVDSKINRIKIHRKINNLLKEEFSKGLHSLEIKIN